MIDHFNFNLDAVNALKELYNKYIHASSGGILRTDILCRNLQGKI